MNNHNETIDRVIELKNQKQFCAIFQLEDSRINRFSDEDDFQLSYRKLLLKVYPDKNINNNLKEEEAKEVFILLRELKKGKFKLAKIDTTRVFSKLERYYTQLMLNKNSINLKDKIYETFQFVDPTISEESDVEHLISA